MVTLNGIEIYIYLFCNAVSIFTISIFMDIFFDKGEQRRNNYLRVASYILYWSISSATYLLIQSPSMVMLALTIIGTSIISLTYNGTWKYRICSIVTTIAVQIVCENTAWVILVKLHAVQLFIIGLIIVQILTFMIAIILHKMVDLKRGEEILLGDWIAVTVIPIWSIYIVSVVLDGCENEIDVAICGTSMLLINILVFLILNRMQNVYRKQMDLGILEQQNKAYEYQARISKASEDRINALNHDIKNHFLVLDQLAEKGNNHEIRLYLKDLNMSAEFDKQWVYTGNHVVDGLLNIKLDEAAQYEADVITSINISQDMNVNSRTISIILGNLLDNALQAIKRIDDKNIKKFLTIKMREEPGCMYIHIINSHNENLRKRGKSFQTTKGASYGHGIGLKNVEHTVADCGGHMEIEYTDEMFSVEIIIFF